MRLFFLFLMSAFYSSAQNEGLFYFAITDGLENNILPSKYWKVSGAIQDGDTLPIYYLAEDTAYLLKFPDDTFGKIIQIQVTYTAGTYTGIMNVYFKTAGKNGDGACNACAITNMIYNPGNFMLDLPYQNASWELIEDFNLIFNGKENTLKNISMLQNWSEPNLK